MASSSAAPQYLVIGHVTHDLLPDGSFRLGGTATYSALAAAALGLSVGVLTSGADDAGLLPSAPNLQVSLCPAAQSSVFENIYTGSHRRQYIRALARTLTARDVPAGWQCAPIVHLGPVCREVGDDLIDAFPHSLLGVTPQGFLRCWDGDGLVMPCDWPGADHAMGVADVVVLSFQDLAGDARRLAAYAERARLLVLTMGEEGAIVHWQGRRERVRAFDVTEVDPTGAGDVFATAFLIRYRETGDPLQAALYANCVASFCVEAPGTTNLPTRDQVDWRLRHGRMRR